MIWNHSDISELKMKNLTHKEISLYLDKIFFLEKKLRLKTQRIIVILNLIKKQLKKFMKKKDIKIKILDLFQV